MKTKSEISDLLILICDFYNSYRTILEYSHEEAKSRILNMYDDLDKWLYDLDKWLYERPEKWIPLKYS